MKGESAWYETASTTPWPSPVTSVHPSEVILAVLLGTVWAVLLKVNVMNRLRVEPFIIRDCTFWTIVIY